MWGMGVTSLMLVTTKPAPCNDRMAASLPAPGPLINTSMCLRPWSIPLRAACSAARWAAKAVPLREPLNPTVPALAKEMTLPWGSVMLIKVLGHDAALPPSRSRSSHISNSPSSRLMQIILDGYFLPPVRLPRPATVRRGPLRVRALVRVRWPFTGNPRRWRSPR